MSRVRISPGDVTIRTGEHVTFTAIAYDKDGSTISGLDVSWEGLDEDKKTSLTVSPRAVFASGVPGHYKITANVAGRQAHVKVTVVGEERLPNVTSSSAIPISSRDPKPAPKKTSSLAPVGGSVQVASTTTTTAKSAGSKRQPLRAATSNMALRAPMQVSGEDTTGWNTTNYMTADDPGTERGDTPGHAPDGGAGSGDMQFAVPLIGLDGRGIDLNLGLAYNSRLWHKSGSDMYFDIDRDWIPGWTLGFGKIVMAGNGYMLVDGNGTRHSYNGIFRNNFSVPLTSLQSFEGYTTDGTFIDYYAEGYKPQFDNSGGKNVQYAWAKLPNGTHIDYGAPANYAIYPTRITDANGNYITITYRNNEGPNIDTITDTLGRVIHFYYDSTGLLTAVTAPGMRDAQGQWTDRTIAQFQYSAIPLNNAGTNYGFVGSLVTHVRQNTIPTIKAVYFPATGTGYWFGDIDSYSPYGMIRKVSERRGMTITGGSLTQQGTISAGYMSRQMTYSHSTSPGYSFPHISGSLSDTPTFTQSTEDWAARDTSSAPVTQYAVVDNPSTLLRTTTITRPDLVIIEQDIDNNPSSSNYGLVVEDRTYADSSRQRLLHKSKVFWAHDALPSSSWCFVNHGYGAPRPTRTEVTDDRGQTTATTYNYGPYFNAVVDVSNKDYDGTTLLRRTHTDYNNSTAYNGYLINCGTLWWHAPGTFYGGPQWSGPHIFNLASAVEIYASDDTTRVSHTEYQYDQTPAAQLVDTPNVTQHTTASDYRGNLTSTKHYADAAGLSSSTAVVETRGYDICGNVRTLSTSCCEQTSFTYTINTEFAWPETAVRGSATDTTKQITTSAIYDLNTGLVKGAYDANGRYSNTSYQTTTLRPEFEYAPTGAYKYRIYDDTNLVVYDLAYEANQSGGNFASRSDKYIDGHGRVHGEIAYTAGYDLDIVETQFDNLGRLLKQTRPYRYVNGNETKAWHTYKYDKLDRVVKAIAPDNSAVQRCYNQNCYDQDADTYTSFNYPSVATPNALGQTALAKDAWGRERWARFDAQDRMVEVVEPDPSGSGTVTSDGWFTRYTYNTLGNLTLVEQSAQYNQAAEQTRSFKYDSLGRLTHQKLAERNATLDAAGQHYQAGGGTGVWSDVFSYDNRSNLIWRVDARGVKTTFDYGNDPLNRLQSVSYSKSGVPSGQQSSIIDAAMVSYSYVTSGDLTRLLQVTDGMGTEDLTYDSEFRLNQKKRKFPNRTANPLEVDYLWDSLNRLSELKYPAEYYQFPATRKVEQYNYDLASRVSGATFDGSSFASQIAYNAASQTLALTVGGVVNELYSYEAETGLLTNQQVKKGTTTHLNLNYEYALTTNGPKTGQLTKITNVPNPSRSKAYVYDKLGRLEQVKGGSDPTTNPQWTQTYEYDRYGNRKSVSKSGPGAGSIPLDGLAALAYTDGQGKTVTNRVTTGGYSYDAAGNQTRGETDSNLWRQYLYDAAGRLVTTLADDGVTVLASYGYGASNQRLQQTESGVTTCYAWDGNSILGEYQAVGANNLQWSKSYVYLGGRLLATRKISEGVRYHHPDRLGTRIVTDTAGNLLTEQVTLPYGTALDAESSGTATNRRFTSYDRSLVTKLDYAVNRFYNAGQGRFTQVDPIGMGAVDLADPQTLNLYAYCGNDPINRVDPDGLFSLKKLFGWVGKILKWVAIAVAVAVAVLIIIPAPWAGAALGWLMVFASSHPTLASIIGLGGAVGTATTPPILGRDPGVSGVSNFVQDGPKGPLPDEPVADVGLIESINTSAPHTLWNRFKDSIKFSFVFNGVNPMRVKPIPGSTGNAPYGPCVSFMKVNANYMYRSGGDNPWGQYVRAHLLKEYENKASHLGAHIRSYAWGAVYTAVGDLQQGNFPTTHSKGLGVAVFKAGVGWIRQADEYLGTRAYNALARDPLPARGFTCSDVK